MNSQEVKEFATLKADVSHIKEAVGETKDSIKEMNTTMNRLTSKLFKDDLTGEEGYFEFTKRNGIRLTKLENIRAISYGVIMAIGIMLGWILEVKQH